MLPQTIEKLVWIDLEMTGLNLKQDKIIQIAVLVTDINLNLLDEKGYMAHIKISKKDLTLMDAEVREMHTENGLIDASLKSKLTLKQVDKAVVRYISQFVTERSSPLCGNTISADRAFIEYNMPLLTKHLHYRNIDVSAIKQLWRLWGGKKYRRTDDKLHEAMNDIRGSIDELRYYKEVIFDKALDT